MTTTHVALDMDRGEKRMEAEVGGGRPSEGSEASPPADKELLYREDWENVQRALDGDMAAREWLLRQVTPFIRQLTSIYCASCPSLEGDALSEAWIGVEKAIKNYRPGIAKFTTHAGLYIRGHILDVIHSSLQVVRRPTGQKSRARALLRKADDRTAGPTALPAAGEGAPPADPFPRKMLADPVRAAMAMIAPDVSLELTARPRPEGLGQGSEGEDEGVSLKDVLTAPDTEPSWDDRHYFFNEALQRSLTPRQYQIVSAYFGLRGQPCQTLEEIAKPLAMTREGVRLILHRTLRHLRSMIEKAEARREIGLTDHLSFMRPRTERSREGKRQRPGPPEDEAETAGDFLKVTRLP